RHTRFSRDWSSDVCSSDLGPGAPWQVRVGMGASRTLPEARTVEIAGLRLDATDVDMGNPHAVAFLPADVDLDGLDLSRRPALDRSEERRVGKEWNHV